MMKLKEAYFKADQLGAGFVANVIANWHMNKTRKMNGLVRLLEAGHEVRTAQFDASVLIIDGVKKPWTELEREAK
jgi:hypothetical protein